MTKRGEGRGKPENGGGGGPLARVLREARSDSLPSSFPLLPSTVFCWSSFSSSRLIPLAESPPRNIIMPRAICPNAKHESTSWRAAGVNGPINESGIKAAVTRPRTRLSRATGSRPGGLGGSVKNYVCSRAPSWIMASSFRGRNFKLAIRSKIFSRSALVIACSLAVV